jgi:6-phosphogluconolactonase
LAFHPAGAYAYAIQENDSTMTAYTITTGQLAAIQTLSTRAAGAAGANTGAEVAVHPTGKFLYGSNRGDDNIVRYTLDAAGRMTLAGHTPSGGQTPRHFSIDPSGKFLLVANQASNNVVVFAIDPQSGALSAAGAPITAPSPSFVGVVTLPGS